MANAKQAEPTAVVLRESQEVAAPQITPQQTLSLAIEKGVDPDVLKKMMELQERWEANEAKKAYTVAIARFKRSAPAVLEKTGKVDFSTSKGRTRYSHAKLGPIMSQITDGLSVHGLSASWSTQQANNSVSVTCHITHERGHSESTTLSAPPDDSGNKNRIQQIGSTVTYLQRYTLLALLGLATADQDDDGMAAGQAVRGRPPVAQPDQLMSSAEVDAEPEQEPPVEPEPAPSPEPGEPGTEAGLPIDQEQIADITAEIRALHWNKPQVCQAIIEAFPLCAKPSTTWASADILGVMHSEQADKFLGHLRDLRAAKEERT